MTLPDRIGAVVVGGDYRGLGMVRSLGRRGVPVDVLLDEHRLAGFSRYVRRAYNWPKDPTGQLGLLLRLGTSHPGWVLLPTGDESAALIARAHDRLKASFRLTTPPWESFRWAYDKRLTYQLAERLAIPHPRTATPGSRADLASLDLTYPVILKPAFKARPNRFTREKAWRVDRPADLPASYDAACGLVEVDRVMIQELIPGAGDTQYSYAALCDRGRPLATLVARRTRQYPLEFGRSSTFVETIDLAELNPPAERILQALNYSGLVEVEFKYDRRDGHYKLLDVNPRVWGWHTLGRRAGVDFPCLLWKQALGQPIEPARAQPGVRWNHLVNDVGAAVQAIRLGRLAPVEYLRSFRGPLEYAVLASDDPLPGLLESPLLVALALKRVAWRGVLRAPGEAVPPRLIA